MTQTLPALPVDFEETTWTLVPDSNGEESPEGWESNGDSLEMPTIWVMPNPNAGNGATTWCVSIDPRSPRGPNHETIYCHAEGHAKDLETAKRFAHKIARGFIELLSL